MKSLHTRSAVYKWSPQSAAIFRAPRARLTALPTLQVTNPALHQSNRPSGPATIGVRPGLFPGMDYPSTPPKLTRSDTLFPCWAAQDSPPAWWGNRLRPYDRMEAQFFARSKFR